MLRNILCYMLFSPTTIERLEVNNLGWILEHDDFPYPTQPADIALLYQTLRECNDERGAQAVLTYGIENLARDVLSQNRESLRPHPLRAANIWSAINLSHDYPLASVRCNISTLEDLASFDPASAHVIWALGLPMYKTFLPSRKQGSEIEKLITTHQPCLMRPSEANRTFRDLALAVWKVKIEVAMRYLEALGVMARAGSPTNASLPDSLSLSQQQLPSPIHHPLSPNSMQLPLQSSSPLLHQNNPQTYQYHGNQTQQQQQQVSSSFQSPQKTSTPHLISNEPATTTSHDDARGYPMVLRNENVTRSMHLQILTDGSAPWILRRAKWSDFRLSLGIILAAHNLHRGKQSEVMVCSTCARYYGCQNVEKWAELENGINQGAKRQTDKDAYSTLLDARRRQQIQDTLKEIGQHHENRWRIVVVPYPYTRPRTVWVKLREWKDDEPKDTNPNMLFKPHLRHIPPVE